MLFRIANPATPPSPINLYEPNPPPPPLLILDAPAEQAVKNDRPKAAQNNAAIDA